MYPWIWRHLPGPLVARLVQSLVLVGLAVLVLFLWVFPRVESDLPYQDVTVPGPNATGTQTPAPSTGPSSAPTSLPTELPAG